jgi:hypothetical protein
MIAISQCIMEPDDIPTLTIGKDYKIIREYYDPDFEENCVEIIDDDNEEHGFRMSELNDFFNVNVVNIKNRKPYRCPVCVGSGSVPPGFYSHTNTTSAAYISCRSCNGTGIVWGE